MAKILRRRKAAPTRRQRPVAQSRVPRVFAMHKDDILEPKHKVIWSKTGDLNRAAQRGQVKHFSCWPAAKAFSAVKARQIGATKAKKVSASHRSYHG
jgi:hypothetical protein